MRHKLWARLPYDGQGFRAPPDAGLAELRRLAAAGFWKRTPWWTRPLLIPLARLAWGAASLAQSRRLSADCISSGARPNEAFIWRHFFPPPGPHPLPGRAAGVLLSQLGSAEERLLLRDKQAAAERLEHAGLPTPRLFEIIPRGKTIDTSGLHWSRPERLFVKPRHGSAGRGAMPGSAFLRQTPVAVPSEDLLVQARLDATPETADLAASGSAPVLRLTTARFPGEAPFLHSALVSIDVPGERPRDFIRGQVRVPVDVTAGRMGPGIWFLHPGERYSHLPWNDAPLAGRSLPCFDCAAGMVLRAMALVPGLPLVNWDLILTPEGPVILEGNTAGDWILTNLSTVHGIETVPLVPLLRQWASMPCHAVG